jgi:hypothetical protein
MKKVRIKRIKSPKTKMIDALRETVVINRYVLDSHIAWLNTNPADHQDVHKVERGMLNVLFILHEMFPFMDQLFRKKSERLSPENLILYKKIFLQARTKGDLPMCQNKDCLMEVAFEASKSDELFQKELTDIVSKGAQDEQSS